MRVRTIEQLEARLDQALAWRKRELTTLALAVRDARAHQKALLLRAGGALLYAHWEGFVKDAAETYIELVEEQGHRCGDLAANFVVLSIGRLLAESEQSRKTRFRLKLVEFLRNEDLEHTRVSTKGVDTRSNLNSEVLRDIVELLGLDYAPYELKANLIDESLLDTRNKIAHGEFVAMDEQGYLPLQTEMVALMQLLRDQIGNAAAQRLYLRQGVNPSV